MPLVGFEKWWSEDGKYLDPDTSDVSWYDKREALSHIAFDEGIKIGMARAANYTTNDGEEPDVVEFTNGRTVKIIHDLIHGVYLEIGMKE